MSRIELCSGYSASNGGLVHYPTLMGNSILSKNNCYLIAIVEGSPEIVRDRESVK